jgi:olefin beta-lactone synthetase
MNLVEQLQHHAADRPHAPALLDTRSGSIHRLTFAGLEEAASRAATFFHHQGLRPGDAVLIFHPMSADLYIALAAIFRLGLVALFLDPAQGRMHIDHCCALLPPKALLASPKAHLLRFVSPALRCIPVKFATGLGAPRAIRWRRYSDHARHAQIFDATADTPALITFTSGSTGQPKAAVRTHGFLLQQHAVLEQTLGLSPEDVVLTTLPIFVLSHLAAGVRTLLPAVDIRHPGRIDPAPLVAQIGEQRATCLEASPALLERIVQFCAARGQMLPTLRKIFTGGGPVFPKVLEQTQAVAPHAVITAVYGSTEAEPIAHIGYHEISQADQTRMASGGGLVAGKPVAAIQVRIMPDRWGAPMGPFTAAAFAAQCLPPDTSGEIVVSGPHVLTGYWHGQGDQETKFRVDGTIWHRTGDAGYFDATGQLWLVGRCAARSADEHGVIYPLAVETVVRQHPQVRQCAFLTQAGQRILVLECTTPLAATELTQLQARLAWARVSTLRVLDHIPVDKRHNAKIDYPALRNRLARS